MFKPSQDSNADDRLTFKVLKHYYTIGLRNGSVYRLGRVERKFYEACLMFARSKGAIVSSFVVGMLRKIIDRLKPLKERAYEAGLRRARELFAWFKSSGVFRWAPQVKKWLIDKSYIAYLGFMELNNPPRFAW